LHVIELALKMSPFPLSVQRKKLEDAEALYKKVCESIERGDNKLLELTCEQVICKKIAVLPSEIIGVQIYQKTSSLGGNKRPGFSL